jgi:hypothetical protein
MNLENATVSIKKNIAVFEKTALRTIIPLAFFQKLAQIGSF